MKLQALAAAILMTVSPAFAQNTEDPDSYTGLRNQALSVTRQRLKLPAPSAKTKPWGVIMDTAYPDGKISTVVTFENGSASIYLSTGGGYIGGDKHSKIRQAVEALMVLAVRYQPAAVPVKSADLPEPGEVRFYFRTDAGVFTSRAFEDELAGGQHRLSPLYYAVQKVITEYRLLDESAKKAP